jgi:hypothetical protein
MTDESFHILFGNAPIKLQPNQRSQYSVYAATQTMEELWFHSLQR